MLKQPSRFVAAALVTACLLAVAAAAGGLLLIDGVTRTALAVHPAGTRLVHPAVSGSGLDEAADDPGGTRAAGPSPTHTATLSGTR